MEVMRRCTAPCATQTSSLLLFLRFFLRLVRLIVYPDATRHLLVFVSACACVQDWSAQAVPSGHVGVWWVAPSYINSQRAGRQAGGWEARRT